MPICLKSRTDIENVRGTLVGFDTTEFSENLRTIQEMPVNVVSTRECRSRDMYLKQYLSEFTFCGEYMNGMPFLLSNKVEKITNYDIFLFFFRFEYLS